MNMPNFPQLPHLNGGFKTAVIRSAIAAIFTAILAAGGFAWKSNRELESLHGQAAVVHQKLDALADKLDRYVDWSVEDSRRLNERLNRMNDRIERLRETKKAEDHLPPFEPSGG